jgi:hypothetical protein
MKNNDSIKRAIDKQKKNDEFNTARLQAIDYKIASPRVSLNSTSEIEIKPIKDTPSLKV